MIKQDVRDALDAYGKDMECEVIILDNPSYDSAIVGISNDGRLIYDESMMAADFAEENDCDLSEAYEFIEYNTVRACPYMGEHAPIIMEISLNELLEKYGK